MHDYNVTNVFDSRLVMQCNLSINAITTALAIVNARLLQEKSKAIPSETVYIDFNLSFSMEDCTKYDTDYDIEAITNDYQAILQNSLSKWYCN